MAAMGRSLVNALSAAARWLSRCGPYAVPWPRASKLSYAPSPASGERGQGELGGVSPVLSRPFFRRARQAVAERDADDGPRDHEIGDERDGRDCRVLGIGVGAKHALLLAAADDVAQRREDAPDQRDDRRLGVT